MSPETLLSETIESVLLHIPGIRDGEPESVHQARVGTRRLRELLPLVPSVAVTAKATEELIRNIGRSLGVVRELDSLIQLTGELAQRYPGSAPLLAATRTNLDQRRQRKVRQLVKRIEDVDVEILRDAVPRAPGFFPPRPHERKWRPELAHRLEMRADRLERKVERASGVYFPNRLHKVRISLKKLRYLAEIAEQTRTWQPAHLVRDAKRLQDTLGAMHDMQVLLEYVDRLDGEEWRSAAAAFRSLLNAELAERHREYLAHRERLGAMAKACRRFARSETSGYPWRGSVSLAAALLVPAGAVWLHQRREPAPPRQIAPALVAPDLQAERAPILHHA